MLCWLQNGAVAAHRAGGHVLTGCEALGHGRVEGWGSTDAELPLPHSSKVELAPRASLGNRGRELIKDQFLIFCFRGNAEQQQKCWSR